MFVICREYKDGKKRRVNSAGFLYQRRLTTSCVELKLFAPLQKLARSYYFLLDHLILLAKTIYYCMGYNHCYINHIREQLVLIKRLKQQMQAVLLKFDEERQPN